MAEFNLAANLNLVGHYRNSVIDTNSLETNPNSSTQIHTTSRLASTTTTTATKMKNSKSSSASKQTAENQMKNPNRNKKVKDLIMDLRMQQQYELNNQHQQQQQIISPIHHQHHQQQQQQQQQHQPLQLQNHQLQHQFQPENNYQDHSFGFTNSNTSNNGLLQTPLYYNGNNNSSNRPNTPGFHNSHQLVVDFLNPNQSNSYTFVDNESQFSHAQTQHSMPQLQQQQPHLTHFNHSQLNKINSSITLNCLNQNINNNTNNNNANNNGQLINQKFYNNGFNNYQSLQTQSQMNSNQNDLIQLLNSTTSTMIDENNYQGFTSTNGLINSQQAQQQQQLNHQMHHVYNLNGAENHSVLFNHKLMGHSDDDLSSLSSTSSSLSSHSSTSTTVTSALLVANRLLLNNNSNNHNVSNNNNTTYTTIDLNACDDSIVNGATTNASAAICGSDVNISDSSSAQIDDDNMVIYNILNKLNTNNKSNVDNKIALINGVINHSNDLLNGKEKLNSHSSNYINTFDENEMTSNAAVVASAANTAVSTSTTSPSSTPSNSCTSYATLQPAATLQVTSIKLDNNKNLLESSPFLSSNTVPALTQMDLINQFLSPPASSSSSSSNPMPSNHTVTCNLKSFINTSNPSALLSSQSPQSLTPASLSPNNNNNNNNSNSNNSNNTNGNHTSSKRKLNAFIENNNNSSHGMKNKSVKNELNHNEDIDDELEKLQQQEKLLAANRVEIPSPTNAQMEEINTKDLAHKISSELKRYSIPQAVFAQRVLCRSQGTLSDLLRNPKPWSKLKSGRETFRRMYKWLQEPEAQRMNSLRLAAAIKRKEEESDDPSFMNEESDDSCYMTSTAGDMSNEKKASDEDDDNDDDCDSVSAQMATPSSYVVLEYHNQQQQQAQTPGEMAKSFYETQRNTNNNINTILANSLNASLNHSPKMVISQMINDPSSTTTTHYLNSTTSSSSTSSSHQPQMKKPRLVFTDIQRRTLQAIFKETKRPSKEMQVTIAQQLGLEVATVSNFFMNARRRSMDKWKDQDDEDSNSSSLK